MLYQHMEAALLLNPDLDDLVSSCPKSSLLVLEFRLLRFESESLSRHAGLKYFLQS